jgi:thiamine kinase-like enzyme
VRLIVQRYVEAVSELGDILEQLESSLGPLTEGPVPLTGGITNRNFRVRLGETEYVIRRPGKDTDLLGIDRESERLATDGAAALGIAPAVAARVEDCLVTRFIACSAVSAQQLAARVEEIARALRAFHDSQVRLPTSFRIPDLLDNYLKIVRSHGETVPAGYTEAVVVAARIESVLPPIAARPCHNDLLAGNIIRAREDGRLMIVDWEYAGMGDPRFDLGNLSINNGFDEAADERLLSAYYGARPTDAQRAALALMRVLSDAREGAWGVVQGQLSELDFDFAGYASEHFERMRAAAASGDFEQWLAAADGLRG